MVVLITAMDGIFLGKSIRKGMSTRPVTTTSAVPRSLFATFPGGGGVVHQRGSRD